MRSYFFFRQISSARLPPDTVSTTAFDRLNSCFITIRFRSLSSTARICFVWKSGNCSLSTSDVCSCSLLSSLHADISSAVASVHGRRIVNLLPCPSALSTVRVPPIASVSCFTIASPRPMPAFLPMLLPRSKISKIRSSSSFGIPMPLSLTVRASCRFPFSVLTSAFKPTKPLSVYFMEFDSRFVIT